ncbi:hypothetical protein PR202_ga07163 [Eleusine coracana subsp. coracana]|uniref:RNase H type-1 domain-containing protein n=1 Tax=Eleusine coracana subsp. coracana TaxID=191504 RepID=A0AAV5BYK2_ELECO|nr:hypothetical protein PR202_ga07163 [Eleusine coracana subsp. coracana]
MGHITDSTKQNPMDDRSSSTVLCSAPIVSFLLARTTGFPIEKESNSSGAAVSKVMTMNIGEFIGRHDGNSAFPNTVVHGISRFAQLQLGDVRQAGSTGFVIRDSSSECIVAVHKYLSHVIDAQMAEAMALRDGLELAQHIASNHFVVQSDCLEVV